MTLRDNSLNNSKSNLSNRIINSIDPNNAGLTKEQLLLINLKDIANEYLEIEQLKDNFVKKVLKNLDQLDFSEFLKYPNYNIKEKFLKKEVSVANIRGLNVVSVDGSSVVKKFMNVDFSFLKAIAVKYYFLKNNISKINYYPDISGYNNYYVQGNYLNREESAIDSKISMEMTFMEINLLNKLLERNDDIDLIIIDGSIVIMPINLLFAKDFEISKAYDKLLKEYQKLYINCKEREIILIGSIKDTRTSALTHLLKSSIQMLKPNTARLNDFIELNYRQILEYFSDVDIFNRILSKYERSCIFNCKREIDKIRDTGIKKEIPYYFPFNFYAFYLKTAQYDTPCRFEFFTDESDSNEDAARRADLISSILLSISSYNEFYGLPIPQIEAHRRAVFKSPEINLLFNNLLRTLKSYGISLIEKRRTRRPF